MQYYITVRYAKTRGLPAAYSLSPLPSPGGFLREPVRTENNYGDCVIDVDHGRRIVGVRGTTIFLVNLVKFSAVCLRYSNVIVVGHWCCCRLCHSRCLNCPNYTTILLVILLLLLLEVVLLSLLSFLFGVFFVWRSWPVLILSELQYRYCIIEPFITAEMTE